MGWYKVFDEETLSDEKLKALPLEHQGAFFRIMCVANKCLLGGKLFDYGKNMSVNMIAEASDVPTESVEILIYNGFLVREDGGIKVSNWKRYQNDYERQKPYRHKEKQGSVKVTNRVTPKVTSEVTTQEVRSKNKELRTKTKETPSPSAGDELTPFRKLCLLWSNTMESETGSKGPFNGRDGKNLTELLKIAKPENIEKVIVWMIKTGRKNQFLSAKCDRLYKLYENWNLLSSRAGEEKVVPLAGSKYKSEAVEPTLTPAQLHEQRMKQKQGHGLENVL